MKRWGMRNHSVSSTRAGPMATPGETAIPRLISMRVRSGRRQSTREIRVTPGRHNADGSTLFLNFFRFKLGKRFDERLQPVLGIRSLDSRTTSCPCAAERPSKSSILLPLTSDRSNEAERRFEIATRRWATAPFGPQVKTGGLRSVTVCCREWPFMPTFILERTVVVTKQPDACTDC